MDEPCLYLCGNSLGLQPKGTRKLLEEELTTWARRCALSFFVCSLLIPFAFHRGVNGHFDHEYGRPWVTIDETVRDESACLVGALPLEVIVMNTLTSNLHFLMASFYRPTKDRYKIVFEEKAFPSDHVRVEFKELK